MKLRKLTYTYVSMTGFSKLPKLHCDPNKVTISSNSIKHEKRFNMRNLGQHQALYHLCNETCLCNASCLCARNSKTH